MFRVEWDVKWGFEARPPVVGRELFGAIPKGELRATESWQLLGATRRVSQPYERGGVDSNFGTYNP